MPVYLSFLPEGASFKGVNEEEVRRFAERVLRELGLEEAELSLVLTDEGAIRELNRRWKQKDRPTDVLTFYQDCPDRDFPEDFDAEEFLKELRKSCAGCRVLGDVVVSVDAAKRQAEEVGWSFEDELKRLVLHGIVHSLGLDHELSPEQDRKFRALEKLLWERVEGKPFKV
ncbi:MAG: rRNA maturation RNase YbeY [Aquificae bacterium]|nr:rRNA maturation RNase YbeY [Aquificota bacterium]